MNKKFNNRISLLWFFLKGQKRYFAATFFFAAMVSLFDLLNPRIISFTVDAVLTGMEEKVPDIIRPIVDRVGGLIYIREHLYLIALAVLLVALCRFVSRYFFQYSNARGEEGVVRRMREILYDHIIRLPQEWHSANTTGDIIQRCTSDVDTIRQFLADQLTNLLRVIVLIAMAIFFMVRINPTLTVVAVLLVPVIIGYSLVFYGKVGKQFYHVDTMEGRLSAMVQENLTGIRVVRAFGREAYERSRFEAYNEKYMQTWVHLMKLLSIFWSIGDLVSGLQVLLIVSVGAVLCVQGTLSAGEYIEFITYNSLLTWPVRMLGRVISD
ncbi:MAG: ABC transporter ATP-binding protein, partial [Lachnospiraceae bacterium]|nr:ABC transporter ATP-binding protein [Lachnospiraceae bacterium]